MNEKQIVFKLSELESELDRKKWNLKLEEEKYEKNKPVQPTRQIAQLILYPVLVPKVKYNLKLGIIIPSALGVGWILFSILSIRAKFFNILSYLCFIGAIICIILAIVKLSDDKKKDIE